MARAHDRRPLARHRALWAFGPDGPLLVATDCSWLAAALPPSLVAGLAQLVCPRCERVSIDVPDLDRALDDLATAGFLD